MLHTNAECEWVTNVCRAAAAAAALNTLQKSGGEVVAVEDVNWKEDTKGLPGRQLGLQLLLRVVADVGIVGFPNAGGRCSWVATYVMSAAAYIPTAYMLSINGRCSQHGHCNCIQHHAAVLLPRFSYTSCCILLDPVPCRQVVAACCADARQP
jgi:hypothetical protein